jgi:hypothetical protein
MGAGLNSESLDELVNMDTPNTYGLHIMKGPHLSGQNCDVAGAAACCYISVKYLVALSELTKSL